MVNENLPIGVLQLVALALPAFAILIELIVRSDIPYVNQVVPLLVSSFCLVVFSGVIVLSLLILNPLTLLMRIALGILNLGLLILIVGIALVGLRTRKAQLSSIE